MRKYCLLFGFICILFCLMSGTSFAKSCYALEVRDGRLWICAQDVTIESGQIALSFDPENVRLLGSAEAASELVITSETVTENTLLLEFQVLGHVSSKLISIPFETTSAYDGGLLFVLGEPPADWSSAATITKPDGSVLEGSKLDVYNRTGAVSTLWARKAEDGTIKLQVYMEEGSMCAGQFALQYDPEKVRLLAKDGTYATEENKPAVTFTMGLQSTTLQAFPEKGLLYLEFYSGNGRIYQRRQLFSISFEATEAYDGNAFSFYQAYQEDHPDWHSAFALIDFDGISQFSYYRDTTEMKVYEMAASGVSPYYVSPALYRSGRVQFAAEMVAPPRGVLAFYDEKGVLLSADTLAAKERYGLQVFDDFVAPPSGAKKAKLFFFEQGLAPIIVAGEYSL